MAKEGIIFYYGTAMFGKCHRRINTPQKCRLNLPQFAP